MEGETAPVAPVAAPEAAPATSEAPVINSNPEPAPAQTPTANIPADQIEAFNRFIGANGGYEKAFAKLKSAVSGPAPQAQPVQQPQVQQPQAQPMPQYDQQYIPAGHITQEEFATQQYFNALSHEEQYAPIAEQIRTGAVLKDMAQFGIRPMQNGSFNDAQIRKFLNLLSKTVPAKAPETPLTSAPTVDYVNVGEQVTSRDDALRIIQQNHNLGNGVAPHPQTEAAKQFLKEYYKNK